MTHPVLLTLPFTGRWLVQNSPAHRIPSHGTDLLGERYAIDFVGVDDLNRTSAVRDWRTFVATEPPERFVAFGRAILAPVDGVVVRAHDGEADHSARRSQLALIPYAVGQAGRLRSGIPAVAGNHVVIADRVSGAFVALVHLRHGSLRVRAGSPVQAGDLLGECGNSGNSTQPHVHVQAMDSADVTVAHGLPVVFTGFQERSRTGGLVREVAVGMPDDGAIVEPCPGSPGSPGSASSLGR